MSLLSLWIDHITNPNGDLFFIMKEVEQLQNQLAQLSAQGFGWEDFLHLFRKYCDGPGKIDNWEAIRSPGSQDLVNFRTLKTPDSIETKKILSKLAVCKLNGGLGTSMGCSGPKSSIVVREGKTFLDLIVRQLKETNKEYGVDIPLVLMNSFYTQEETDQIIGKYKDDLEIISFQQNKYPRLTKDTHKPIDEKKYGREAWYPPGHGDFYPSLHQQGLLDKLIDRGIEIIFVSNADNLGAVVDARIPSHMLTRDVPFVMEMTRKTLADVKGGTLYLDGEGHLKLLELARVPEDHIEEFCSLNKFKFFNTNNIWINLRHLKRRLDEGAMDLDVIVNQKKVDGVEVIQLETAIGSALGSFSGAVGLVVNRDRFLPVKKTNDLLLVQSDLFLLDAKGFLARNPARTSPDLPQVEFGETFTRLEDFQERIPDIPSMIDLEKLVLDGDVWLESDLVLKGNVTLISRNGRLTISKGTVVENEVRNQ